MGLNITRCRMTAETLWNSSQKRGLWIALTCQQNRFVNATTSALIPLELAPFTKPHLEKIILIYYLIRKILPNSCLSSFEYNNYRGDQIFTSRNTISNANSTPITDECKFPTYPPLTETIYTNDFLTPCTLRIDSFDSGRFVSVCDTFFRSKEQIIFF